MKKALLILVIFAGFIFADTAYVNLDAYENVTVNLCDENLTCDSNECRFIVIKDYGLLYVTLAGMCTWKPTFGIFGGEMTYGLSIDSSLNLQYDTLEEEWENNQIPQDLAEVPKTEEALTTVYNFDEIVHLPDIGTVTLRETGTNNEINLLPFYESGYWGESIGMMTDSWVNIFGNINEVFYLEREGTNTVKFQVVETSPYPRPEYIMRFASDSLGNGKFKIDNTPVNNSFSSVKSHESHQVRLTNNTLYLTNMFNTGYVSIFNIRGQKIFTRYIQGNSLEMPNLSSGVYQYSIAGKNYTYQGSFIIK